MLAFTFVLVLESSLARHESVIVSWAVVACVVRWTAYDAQMSTRPRLDHRRLVLIDVIVGLFAIGMTVGGLVKRPSYAGFAPVPTWWLATAGLWFFLLEAAVFGHPRDTAPGTARRKKLGVVLWLCTLGATFRILQVADPEIVVVEQDDVHARITMATPFPSFVKYTTDGSDPNGWCAPFGGGDLTVTATTVVRASAFRFCSHPSAPKTWPILLPESVVHQDNLLAQSRGFPSVWMPSPGSDGQQYTVADYEMDPEICDSQRAKVTDALRALPSVFLTAAPEAWFGAEGIYSHSLERGRHWERPSVVGMVDPVGKVLFQENCGVRIHGNSSRNPTSTKKHGFRLAFRTTYGAKKLRYALFGPEGAKTFDSLVLRPGGTDGWSKADGDYRLHALYLRDEWGRRAHRAIGGTAGRGMFVHLYLNGLYWGVYNLMERPDDAFMAEHLGGKKSDWDVIKDDSLADGSADSWNDLIRGVRRVSNQQGDASLDAYRDLVSRTGLLDVDSYIDYVLLQMYAANTDWPHGNFVAAYRRDGTAGGFRFMTWDGDFSLASAERGANGYGATYDPIPEMRAGVGRPFDHLRKCEEFRVRFADRVYHHFQRPEGFFYVTPDGGSQAADLFRALAQRLELPLWAESARWGDQLRPTPFRVDHEWVAERERVLRDFFPVRTKNLIAILRQYDLVRDPPSVRLVTLSNGHRRLEDVGPAADAKANDLVGPSAVDRDESSQSDDRTIYYTVDGTDPRNFGGQRSSAAERLDRFVDVPDGRSVTVKLRSKASGKWSALNHINVPSSLD